MSEGLRKNTGYCYHGDLNPIFFSNPPLLIKNIVKSQTSWYNIKSYLEMWNGFGFWNQFETK